MSRLNYNKWDNLQLSDDSDIEVHPNVDKRSMIRWKQRDIHEKREQRKLKLKQFETEVPMNDSLIKRIDNLISSTKAEGAAFVAKEVLRLKAALPYKYEEKKFATNEQPSEDHMIVSLLSQVITAVQKKEQESGGSNVEAERADRLVKELEWHKQRMVDRQKEIEQEKEEIDREQKKWITSEDIRTGWDGKTIVSTTPSAQPKPAPPAASSSKGKQTETVIETLNSPGVTAAAAAEASGDSSDEADVPPLTPSALAFSRIAPLDWDATRQAVAADPSLLTEETGDALMVEAFSQAMKGTKAGEKRATECIEKALVGQYCRSLGRDGVALFFQRMTNSNHAALRIFLDDVAKTSDRIISRAKVVAAERAEKAAAGSEGVEQIQLVPASPDQTITFEIPDGPPPENLEITGEGSEELDPQLVRDFLQKRWDIFQAFPKNFKAALSEKSLDKVNKVLGRMSVEEAEIVVEQLQEAGILSFETPGIVDQTGKSSENPTVTVPVQPKDDASGSVPVQQTEVLNLEDSLD
ncbi:hsp90 co-chaperone Cdc37 [Rhodotorula toruloides]